MLYFERFRKLFFLGGPQTLKNGHPIGRVQVEIFHLDAKAKVEHSNFIINSLVRNLFDKFGKWIWSITDDTHNCSKYDVINNKLMNKYEISLTGRAPALNSTSETLRTKVYRTLGSEPQTVEKGGVYISCSQSAELRREFHGGKIKHGIFALWFQSYQCRFHVFLYLMDLCWICQYKIFIELNH